MYLDVYVECYRIVRKSIDELQEMIALLLAKEALDNSMAGQHKNQKRVLSAKPAFIRRAQCRSPTLGDYNYFSKFT